MKSEKEIQKLVAAEKNESFQNGLLAGAVIMTFALCIVLVAVVTVQMWLGYPG
jgi:hypothetical protein